MSAEFLSRRRFLNTVLATAGSTSVAQAAAQSPAAPAYSVGKWSGPLSVFTLTDLDGKTWQPADLTGRAVLLNFWASWCEPCRAEMPALQQLAERHGPAKLLVLAINFKEKPARALQFVNSNGLTLPVPLDIDGELALRWGAPRGNFAPQSGNWRSFEVTTRVDIAQPDGVTRVWLPIPSINSDYQRSLENGFSRNGSAKLMSDDEDGARMLYVEFAGSEAKPFIELTSRVMTQDRRVDWSQKTASADDAGTLRH